MAMVNFRQRMVGSLRDIEYFDNDTNQKPIGVTLPFNNQNGIFNRSYTNDTQIFTNLKLLILTGRGERYLQPEFGTDIKYILFENISNEDDFKARLLGTITTAISRWMPFLSVTKSEVLINVNTSDKIVDDDHAVSVKMEVNIVGTPSYLPIIIFISDTGNLTIQEALYNG
jgi:phage baseplate assembly protein W